jgi:AraC-like DNA-binding protein
MRDDVLNEIDQGRARFFRHPSFRDTLMLRASFTRHRYELHTHSTYVIAIVTRGAERLRVGAHRHVAAKGAIILVNPEEVHDGEAGTEEGWAYRTLYPPASLLRQVAAELGGRNLPAFRHAVIEDPGLEAKLIDAHRLAETGDVDAEAALFVSLRLLILRHADPHVAAEAEIRPACAQRLERYRDFIEANLAAPIDLATLAGLAGVTRFQVVRDFKRQVGLTPGAYIRLSRHKAAASYIEQGLSLAEASAAAGFADQSHLTRVFRSIQGISPKLFQQACSNRPAR